MMSNVVDIEAPAVPQVAELEVQQCAQAPNVLQEESLHATAAPGGEVHASSEVAKEEALAAEEAGPKRRTFPWWQLILAIVAIAAWCVVLVIAMEPHERGASFETAWKEGQLWAFLLGLLIAFQGLGKLVNPIGYFGDLDPFRVPIPSWLIGTAFLVVELYTGPVLCVGALHADFGALYVIAAVGAILDIAAYFTLSLEAYLRGFAHSWKLKCTREDGACVKNCTCFGVYGAQKLSIWVLLQDVIVAAETAFVAYRIFTTTTIF